MPSTSASTKHRVEAAGPLATLIRQAFSQITCDAPFHSTLLGNGTGHNRRMNRQLEMSVMRTKSSFPAILTFLLIMGVGSAGAQAFELRSPDMRPDQPMPNKFVFNGFDCKGDNISPALRWEHAPNGTKSFALMVHDPDAKTGGAGIWHWVVVDIPATAGSIEQGAGTFDGAELPPGSKQISTDFGHPGWGGPCPPKGHKPHSYNFTLYALKVDHLNLPPTATASHAGFMINRNALAQARLTISYGR